MQGSRRVDSVGEELNANGPFSSYKRERTKKKRGSRVERTKCCRTDFGASLSVLARSLFSAPSLSAAGFRGGSRCFEDRPCTSGSTSDLFSCFLRRSEQRSASVRRPVRFSLASNPCPIAGCNTLICYLPAFIRIYSFVVSACVVVHTRSPCCRAVSLCDLRSCVIGSLSFSTLACSLVQDPRGPASFSHAFANNPDNVLETEHTIVKVYGQLGI